MIQTLDKSFKEIRTVLNNDINEILVCRSLSKNDSCYYTLIRLKDRTVQARLLKILSGSFGNSSISDLMDISTTESGLVIVFRYNRENGLFYYQPLYCRYFSDRLNVAKNFIAELMSTSLPVEILYFLLEDYNLNLRSDGQIYFNYFMDFQLLPDKVDMQDIINKAAEVTLRILTDGLKVISSEVDLFKVKVLRKSFGSFAAIYSDLKRISPEVETGSILSSKIKRVYSREKGNVIFAVKTGLLVLMVAASVFYSITEWHNRTVAAIQISSEVKPAYKGLEKIGTVTLTEEAASGTGNAFSNK